MPTPLVCVTITAATMAELRERRDAVRDADLIELRLDSVRDPDVAGALSGRRRAVLVTCRPVWEGGGFRGAEEERKRLLGTALSLGAEYVDVEWRARFDDLISAYAGRRIVLSSHDFHEVPADLAARVQAMRATGAEVVKVAVAATSLSDCVTLLELGQRSDGDVVLIGMGEHGLSTRVLAARFKSRWTYAGAMHEIGQLPADTLFDEYRFRTIDSSTEVYGLVGAPVAHSVSPAMHNAAFHAARRNAVYLPLPAADADDFVRFGRAFGVKGASVTVPYKVALMDELDEMHPVARRIGAINTIGMTGDRWVGTNTDAGGFLETLRGRVPLGGTRASILGAGGAARAVAVALASEGGSVTIHARNRAQAKRVALQTSASVGPWPPAPGSWDLLVNCTPLGMHPRADESPLGAAELTGRTVYDLVYNPPLTRLLREAQAAGCQAIGGLDMLVAQAEAQFHWWTETRPAADVMRDAALKRLAEFTRDEHHLV